MSFFFGRRKSRGRKVISIMNDLFLVGETFFGAEKSKGAQGKSIMNDLFLGGAEKIKGAQCTTDHERPFSGDI